MARELPPLLARDFQSPGILNADSGGCPASRSATWTTSSAGRRRTCNTFATAAWSRPSTSSSFSASMTASPTSTRTRQEHDSCNLQSSPELPLCRVGNPKSVNSAPLLRSKPLTTALCPESGRFWVVGFSCVVVVETTLYLWLALCDNINYSTF